MASKNAAKEIAHQVAIIPLLASNTYLVGSAELWYLVDTGIPGSATKIKQAAEARFGAGAKPQAIVLTHGHFDHSGSAAVLAADWGVKVYIHPLERPYLSGKSQYPPFDPTAPGVFAAISRLFPRRLPNLEPYLQIVDPADPFPGLSSWQAVFTPGHSPGHLSFFRKTDRVLLAGDAFTTMNQNSLPGLLSKKKKLNGPPVPATTDWNQAGQSVKALAILDPLLLSAGHGQPIIDTDGQLQGLADHFPVPSHGRYVSEPARADETGVTFLPPAPADYAPGIAKSALVLGIAAGVGAAYPKIQALKRRRP